MKVFLVKTPTAVLHIRLFYMYEAIEWCRTVTERRAPANPISLSTTIACTIGCADESLHVPSIIFDGEQSIQLVLIFQIGDGFVQLVS